MPKRHGRVYLTLRLASGDRSYGAEQGKGPLREAIAKTFYSNTGITPGEIFISDGSKCDIGRLQMMFGSKASVAVQVRWDAGSIGMGIRMTQI